MSKKVKMKAERIDIHLPAQTKAIIERAAAILNMTVSDFVVTKASRAATVLIQDHEQWLERHATSKELVDSLVARTGGVEP